jgi:dihydrofolate synthase / folylpolyglutamate synthase
VTYEEAVASMSGLLRFGWKLGNERFEALCARMGNPQRQFPLLHIAGTKGKGSTTALAAGILSAHGFATGAYFSPYVYDLRERVQISGIPIRKEQFAQFMTDAKPHIDALAETDLGQTTEFELKTLLAFLHFAHERVDYGCIEVGIGGRLDATNVVAPTVTAITNIGLDHTNILGDTHALIAAEKAGIIKPGIPCFTGTDNLEALETITRIAQERDAPLVRVIPNADTTPTPNEVRWHADPNEPHTGTLTVATPRAIYDNITVGMNGIYQRANAACAVGAVEELLLRTGQTPNPDAIRKGLAETRLPGRFAILTRPDEITFVMDGAHNAMAAEALRAPLQAFMQKHNVKRLLLVFGMLQGHEPHHVLAQLAPLAARIWVCQPDWKRAQPAEEVAQIARTFTANVETVPDVKAAVRAAFNEATPNDLVLITGSFYTVGEAPPEFLLSL